MPSKELDDLKARISALERSLLPAAFSPTGDYGDEYRDRALGFRLLVHAEIESFIEQRAHAIALKAREKWDKDRSPSKVLISLIAFRENKAVSARDLKDELDRKKTRTEDCVIAACKSYSHTVANNHGIREDNLLKLLFPIGVRAHQLDPVWLSTIDSFGATRGLAAHSAVGAVQQVDPKTEKDTVDKLLQGLEQLDGILRTLDA
jgi:hypothetical protein